MCKLNKKNRGRRTDLCIRPLIRWFRLNGYSTVASCCGHGKYPMSIIAKFGNSYIELLSGTRMNRVGRFYRYDKQGYPYIEETKGEK